ncbi:MAG: aminoglycoside phosphotransferase family protein [Eubacteriales bacterium]
MKSLTKSTVTKEQIEKACKKHFNCTIDEYHELNDGFYNISYLVRLSDGKETVLKIAPPKDVDILTYEKDIMATETLFYKLTFEHTDIKVPRILAEDDSCEIISSPYYFMSKLEGMPLNKIKKITPEMRKNIYITLAEYLAKIHNIKGETFGYITMEKECKGKGCLNSLIVSVDALLRDAKRKNVKLPFKNEEIYEVFENSKKAFDEIEYPVVCHYDLWDGNIFVQGENEGIEITGVIDFERGFYGCPAADFCQAVHYIDFGKDTYFLDTYNKYANKKAVYDDKMKCRIAAYRFYLFLIMRIECDYRDVAGSFLPQKLWVLKDIKGVYKNLKETSDKLL